MQFYVGSRKAIGRSIVAGIVVLIIVLGAVGAYYLAFQPAKTTTSSNTSSSSSSVSSSSSSSSTTTSPFHNTLVIDDVFWPSGSDLNQLYALSEIPYPNWLTYTVYQPLITLDPNALYNQGTLKYVPALADKWSESLDQRTYTFHLRPNVHFSDGNPLNAYQVWAEMYGFYYLSGNSSSFLESYNIFNFANVTFGPTQIREVSQSGLINPNAQVLSMMENQNWPIYVLNSSAVVFHLSGPFNYFLGTMVVYIGLIFDTQWLLDHGGWGNVTSYNSYFNQHPIPGTGPYNVTQVSENSFVKFQQFPGYWGKSLTPDQIAADPYLDPGHAATVLVNAIQTSDVARFTDLSSGTAQIAGIFSQDYKQITANPSTYGTFLFPDKSAVFVGFSLNTHRSPTNITAVRQAIVRAINYSDISQKVFFGGLSPMMGPEYPIFSQFYSLGVQPYKYNLSGAKQILTNAGINAHNLPAVHIGIYSACSYCSDTATIVKNDLELLGLTVVIDPITNWAWPNTAGTVSYSQALGGAATIDQMEWFGTGTFAPAADTPADNWLLSVSNVTVSNNWAIYANPTVQKCVNGFTSVSNTNQLIALCTAAQQQIYNDAPYVWLGTIKPFFGAGSVCWEKSVVNSFYVDPVFSGQSSTVIFNTVTFVS